MKTIKARIILTVVICSLLSAGICGGISVVNSGRSEYEDSKEEMRYICENLGAQMEAQLERVEQSVNTAYSIVLQQLDDVEAFKKDKAYVEMAYLTGILPIAKYSSGSELNMFFEFSMATMAKYSEYFGFTDEEVDVLYQKYIEKQRNPKVTREGLGLWYDGYQTASGRRLYNPRSVVGALSFNQLGSFWTSSGPYDEIYYYVKNDVPGIREEITQMMAGTPVSASIQEYASTSMELKTRDEIYSAMVVYGFLSYWEGYVSIPNKELMDKFADMVKQRPAFGYMYRLALESGRMLAATKAGDTKTMTEILEHVHNTESPLIRYSDEAELSKVITFASIRRVR